MGSMMALHGVRMDACACKVALPIRTRAPLKRCLWRCLPGQHAALLAVMAVHKRVAARLFRCLGARTQFVCESGGVWCWCHAVHLAVQLVTCGGDNQCR